MEVAILLLIATNLYDERLLIWMSQ